MSTKMVVEGSSGVTVSQLADFFRQLKDGSLTGGMLQAFLEHRDPFARPKVSLADQLGSWQVFYREVFGVEVNFSKLTIPAYRPGFDRLIVALESMTPNRLFAKCKERFNAWRYTDDFDMITSDREPDHTYAIWVRDRIEADEELKSMSANDLKENGVLGIALHERFLYELKFEHETGEHLDHMRVTLCSGSRYSDGDVPDVRWDPSDRMHVSWCIPQSADLNLRARAVVS